MPRNPSPDRSSVVTRHPLRRGEWVDLPALNGARVPRLPESPGRGGWAAGTKLAWKAWWLDPASLMWGPADLEQVRQLAYLHHDMERSEIRGKATLAREVRQRSDDLGLSAKGKQDRRWRVVADEVEGKRSTPLSGSRYQHLKAVPDAVESGG